MDINEYVISEYGNEPGRKINEYQHMQFQSMVAKISNKSENQTHTLKNIILPRIALYKALIELNYTREESFAKIKKYLDEIVGKKMNTRLRKAEKLPGFFIIFKTKMYKEVSSNDNWDVEIVENSKKTIKYNIKKCLWYDACKENECTELCQIFCDVDHIIYGNMKKVDFIRKGTIGKGQDYCDFCYTGK
jgi:hypothetical protein